MFGLGFMEIFVILLVAVNALGPEKLPRVAVDVAKFLKKMKTGIEDAKSTLDKELNVSELKESVSTIKGQMNFEALADLDLDLEPSSKKSDSQVSAPITDNIQKQAPTPTLSHQPQSTLNGEKQNV